MCSFASYIIGSTRSWYASEILCGILKTTRATVKRKTINTATAPSSSSTSTSCISTSSTAFFQYLISTIPLLCSFVSFQFVCFSLSKGTVGLYSWSTAEICYYITADDSCDVEDGNDECCAGIEFLLNIAYISTSKAMGFHNILLSC